MPLLSCLIIEDEPLAADIIKDYVMQTSGLALAGCCADALAATELLRTKKPDLIFLDINLPKLNGLDFLRSGRINCPVILTTAHHEFALDAYNLDVVDYLLKPVSFPRFMQAVNKVLAAQQVTTNTATDQEVHFFVSDKKRIRVAESAICYIESIKDYVKIHTADSSIVTKIQISELEQVLRSGDFVRIHKSFIINLKHLSAYNAQEVEIGKATVPIGRTYQEIFRRRMERM
jgi:DNA-binding LytR/AlgR family response regulator